MDRLVSLKSRPTERQQTRLWVPNSVSKTLLASAVALTMGILSWPATAGGLAGSNGNNAGPGAAAPGAPAGGYGARPTKPGAGNHGGAKGPNAGTKGNNKGGANQGPGCPYRNQQLDLIV